MKKSIVTNLKKLLYYFVVLYACMMCGVFFMSLLKDGPIMELLEGFLLIPIFIFGIWIPYNAITLIIIILVCYFNEIKKKKTIYSVYVALLVGLVLIILYGLLYSNILGDSRFTFWGALSFGSGYTVQVFLLGFVAALFAFVPLHDRFRKKYRFLEEARE